MEGKEDWTHMVVEGDRVVGMARNIVHDDEGNYAGFIQRFGFEDCAEFGMIESGRLLEIENWLRDC